ncbi:MAG TPA: cytochrome c [Planctomycetota bacterium]|nr:cytochrome c [Planctomycetota bacterium]
MRAAGAVLLLLAGCDQAMRDMPRHEPYEPSSFFEDRMSARPIPDGTVARGRLQEDAHRARGRIDGRPAEAFPFEITRRDLLRGRERYGITCAPCHGMTGAGDGPVVRRGFRPPPSFFDPRLVQAPPGHVFEVITRGLGAMPPYDYLVEVDDRWRIAAYIRALQASRAVPVDRLTPEERARLEGSP